MANLSKVEGPRGLSMTCDLPAKVNLKQIMYELHRTYPVSLGITGDTKAPETLELRSLQEGNTWRLTPEEAVLIRVMEKFGQKLLSVLFTMPDNGKPSPEMNRAIRAIDQMLDAVCRQRTAPGKAYPENWTVPSRATPDIGNPVIDEIDETDTPTPVHTL